MSENQQIGLYKIDKDHFEIDQSKAIINQLIKEKNQELEKAATASKGKIKLDKFEELKLRNLPKSNLKTTLFFSRKTYFPKWYEFLENFLPSDFPAKNAKRTEPSYICFIYDDEDIFCITGGLGNFAIQPYIEYDFGLELIQRLIEKGHAGIRGSQDKSVTGSTYSQTKLYRRNISLEDEDGFGKVYDQLFAYLPKDAVDLILGKSSSNSSKLCDAKNSFHLKQAISFVDLISAVENVKKIYVKKRKFDLNSMTVLDAKSKKNKKKIDSLDSKVITKLFNTAKATESFDVDFCHRLTDKYITADHYEMYKSTSKSEPLILPDPLDLKVVLDTAITGKFLSIASKAKFLSSLTSLRVRSLSAENTTLTDSPFIKHVNCEIIDDCSYFLINEKWYRIDDLFIKELDKSVKSHLSKVKVPQKILSKKWSSGDEDSYIKKYLSSVEHLVCHKVLVNNLELADLIYETDAEMYLIHIKSGFSQSMRDLCNQVDIAAKRLQASLLSNKEIIKALHTELTNKKPKSDYRKQVRNQKQIGSLSELKQRFEKKITFVLAVKDGAVKERDMVLEPEKFDSNIAKHSVIELIRKFKHQYWQHFDIGFLQIKR